MTAGLRLAHTRTRDTTAAETARGTTRGMTTDMTIAMGLARPRQQTMARGRRPKAIMDGHPLRSSRGRRLHLPLREMQTTGRRCGGCLGPWTRIVCHISRHLHLCRADGRLDNGTLTEAELRTALVNGDWTPFDPHTVRMMIRMFDTDRSGSVNFDEFWYVSPCPCPD